MDDCVFCKIVKGELPSFKVHEDNNYLAFLDIFPSHKGQTVVIPKKHLPSKLTENDQEEILHLMRFALDVAKKIESKIPEIERCQMVVEGLDLNHLHIKLYPAFFPEPKQHVISKSGDRAEDQELKEFISLING